MKFILLLNAVTFYSVWSYPTLNEAPICTSTDCKIEDDCRCSTTVNPISDLDDPAPQLIALTVSESVVTTLYHNYLERLLFERKNPDGNPIGASFYVNHEYTDYQLVQQLYLRGFEIGSHSITKNSSQEYWRHATLEDLIEEFGGQRQIISRFANIPIEDITGARTPQLQIEGDLSINAYIQSGLSYDNSWPTRSSKRILPYTLDYASTQECGITMNCPVDSHPHFWIAPITDIKGKDNIECNSLATCWIEGTAEEISTWLIGEVDRVRNSNRAPLILRLDSYWFQFTDNSLEGFTLFLDAMATRNDVFFVSVADVINWVKHPVSVSNYKTPVYNREASCTGIICNLEFVDDGSTKYMSSCVRCPEVYPWKGNPMGNYTTNHY